MPKTDDTFDPKDYAPVAERIVQFYARHPTGRIITKPRRVQEGMVLFEARVYRTAIDRHPAATGFASERPGDGLINSVACVENTETSAIGRALANLGITAARQRPSREEMQKADRARQQIASLPAPPGYAPPSDAERAAERRPMFASLATAADLADLEELVTSAERRGWDPPRALEIRALIRRGLGTTADAGQSAVPPEPITLAMVQGLERELQDWLQLNDRAT